MLNSSGPWSPEHIYQEIVGYPSSTRQRGEKIIIINASTRTRFSEQQKKSSYSYSKSHSKIRNGYTSTYTNTALLKPKKCLAKIFPIPVNVVEELQEFWQMKQTSGMSMKNGALVMGEHHLGEGNLLWMDLTPRGAKILSQTRLFRAPETWGVPTVSGGLLYVNQNAMGSRLICYDLRGE